MKTVFGLSRPSCVIPGSIATLGMFDGVHRGHQAVLDRVLARARASGLPGAAVTFENHPDAAFSGQRTPLLTSTRYRLILLERQGLDFCLVLDFTRELASMSAEDFVRRVFVEVLNARAVVVGYDCRFGRDRLGDVGLLEREGARLGFEVEAVGPVEAAGEPISSTSIRRLVTSGDFEGAREMLGRPYSLMGTVVGGAHRGKGLGFPTANLDLQGVILPRDGVYVANVLLGTKEYQALVSIGDRPTFSQGRDRVVVEVYVMDFRGKLYGRELEVQLLRLIRPQRKYASADELSVRMHEDLEYARRYFDGDVEG